jgi:hypothetical protein
MYLVLKARIGNHGITKRCPILLERFFKGMSVIPTSPAAAAPKAYKPKFAPMSNTKASSGGSE